jgi:hypothetical protein
MFGDHHVKSAVSVRVGRLAVRDVRTYAHLFEGHPVQVVLFIEATPGLEHLEVRFLDKKVEVEEVTGAQPAPTAAPASAPAVQASAVQGSAAPALPAAGWFTNPENAQQWRWWDGAKWTTYTSPK